MSKIKKYVYPFIFSIAFIVFYVAVVIFAIVIINDREGYGAAALTLLLTSIWAWLVVPIYCVKYSKVIDNEKLKFLFAAYNVLILSVIHQLPFNWSNDTYIILAVFFIWAALWSTLPLVIRMISRKKQEDPESIYLTDSLLQNKKKKITQICFVSLYLLTLFFNSSSWKFLFLDDFHYALPMISAVLTLVFLLSENKVYWLKKWLLPMAFLAIFVSMFVSVYSSITYMKYIVSAPLDIINFLSRCLTCVAAAVMFAGSLFNFKYINLLKYGALGCIATSFVSLIIVVTEMITAQLYVWDIYSLIYVLAQVLFYIGIFLLTTNKKDSDLV